MGDPVICCEIHDAVRKGDLEKIKDMLIDNPDLISSKDDDGWTPLHFAVATDHKDIAELLLARKAKVDAKDNNGNTPLLVASANGHKDVVELLLKRKANVNSKNKDGKTPLDYAMQNSHQDVVELLRQYGVATIPAPGLFHLLIHDLLVMMILLLCNPWMHNEKSAHYSWSGHYHPSTRRRLRCHPLSQ